MKSIKSKIIAGISALTLIFGVLFIAGAMEDKLDNKRLENVVKVKTLLSTMWFDLDVSSTSNPNNPTDTESEITNEGSPSPSCEPTNPAEVCGIELDVTNILSNNPNYDFQGKTVAQVITDGAQHLPNGANPKSYSRKP